MSKSDFVLTGHVLERMEERFPDLVAGMNDEEIAALIHAEYNDALDNGRHAPNPPLELVPKSASQWWQRKPGAFVVWTKDKRRGYAMKEEDEGMFVITVLFGDSREETQKKLKKGRR